MSSTGVFGEWQLRTVEQALRDDLHRFEEVALAHKPVDIPAGLLRASEHRIAPSTNGYESPLSLIQATVANGKDVLPVPADSHSIRTAIESGVPVVVDGDVALKNGKTSPEWISVEGFDAKTHDFVIAEPGKKSTTEWSPEKLKSFIAGEHGGDAMSITSRPDGAASQKEIDAIMKVVDPASRAAATTTVPLILDECKRLGITDHGQIAYILATAEKESNFGQPNYSNSVPLVEDPDPSTNREPVEYFNKQYGSNAGNTTPVDGQPTNDGYNYRGRGLAQVTHRDSYQTASNHDGFPPVRIDKEPATSLNIDKEIASKTAVPAFVAHPDLVAREDIAVQNIVQGMRDGWYGPGNSLSQFVEGAQRTTITLERRLIPTTLGKRLATALTCISKP